MLLRKAIIRLDTAESGPGASTITQEWGTEFRGLVYKSQSLILLRAMQRCARVPAALGR